MKHYLKFQDYWWGIALHIFGIFILLDLTKWLPLRFWGATSGEHFVDAKQILKSVDCLNVNPTQQLSQFCETYVYGKTLLRLLKFLHLNSSLTGPIGYIFLAFLSTVLGFLLFKSRITFISGLLVIFSPPILLLAERANFDTLMFVLVVSASVLSFRGRNLASTIILGIASASKFYTFPLMFIGGLSAKRWLQQVLILVTSGLLFYQIRIEIILSKELMNPSGDGGYNNGQGFGFNIWAGYLPRLKGIFPSNDSLIGLTLSCCVFILVSLAAFIFLRTKNYGLLKVATNISDPYLLFEFLLIVHVSCFFAGISIDYRLIFIAAATLSYLSASKSLNTAEFERTLLLRLLIISLWCSYPSDGLQIIGDISLSALTSILVFQAVRYRFSRRILFLNKH